MNKNNNKFDYFEFSLKKGFLSFENNFRSFYFIFTFLLITINSVIFNISFQFNFFLMICFVFLYFFIVIVAKFFSPVTLFKNMALIENIISFLMFFTITFYFYVYFTNFYMFNFNFLSKLNYSLLNFFEKFNFDSIINIYNSYLITINEIFCSFNSTSFIDLSTSIYYTLDSKYVFSLDTIIFYFLFLFFILNCFGIIMSKNPINSLLFLISVYVYSSMLLILYNLEFFGLLYVIIYVGAIAVLFLFVIMMLKFEKVSEYKLNNSFNKYSIMYLYMIIPLTFLFFKLYNSNFFIDLIHFKGFFYTNKTHDQLISSFLGVKELSNNSYTPNYLINYFDLKNNLNDLEDLGLSFYTDYNIIFLLCGLVLLISIIAPIMLTFKNRKGVKKQYHSEQLLRNKKNIISLKKNI